jgi:uncharacterized protein
MSVFKALQFAARAAAVVFALVAAIPAADAQQNKQPSAASLKIAHELITITGATALFNPLIAGVVEQAKLLYLQQNPALGKDLNEIADKMRKELEPRFSELADEISKLYATHFTEQELKDIVAFYKSPVGKKMLVQQPIVIDASMSFAQTWSIKLSEEVTAKMREELKKKGHAM